MKKKSFLRIDFVSLCRDNGLDFITEGHHHCSTGWCQLHCPYCSNGDHGFHLGFNIENQNFSCWKCGGKKTIPTYERLLRTSDRREVFRVLNKYQLNGSNTQEIKKKPKPRKRRCPEPPGLGDLQRQHKLYLKRRGFSFKRLAREWGLKGTCHLSLEWNWRIIAPVKDEEGDVCAYNGRIIKDGVKPKYRLTKNDDITINPDSLLYGIDKVDVNKGVVIVEGMTDSWRMGFGAVATLGIKWTNAQANILRKFPKRFVMYDDAPDAQKQAKSLAKYLSAFPGETEVITGIEGDPGELSQKEADRIMKELLN